MDTVGMKISLTLTGASHAPSVGFILEGLPAGKRIDIEGVKRDIFRRSAAAHADSTPRREADDFTIDSGLVNGVTTGEAISFTFPNRAHDRGEYSPIARPSHADYCAYVKSRGCEDISGGGRYSGRMTLPLTAAGSICRQLLSERGIEIFAHVLAIGGERDSAFDPMHSEKPDMDWLFPVLDEAAGERMRELIRRTREAGDTLSCEVECAVLGLPVGLGEPLFAGVESTLSSLLFMIPGLRGVEFGDRLAFGSQMNDCFTVGGRTAANHSGGVNGGMANGMPLVFRCWFRPVPSIALPQTGYDLINNAPVPLTIKGRHDTAILPRGLVAVEAAAALAILDLMSEGTK